MLGKPRPPDRGRRARDGEPFGDLGVLETLGGQQHDPRALRQRLRARAPTRPRLQLGTLFNRQLNPNSNIGWHELLMPAAQDLTHHDTSCPASDVVNAADGWPVAE